jgi:hypothetical protein
MFWPELLQFDDNTISRKVFRKRTEFEKKISLRKEVRYVKFKIESS